MNGVGYNPYPLNKTRKTMNDYERFLERITERYSLRIEDYC